MYVSNVHSTATRSNVRQRAVNVGFPELCYFTETRQLASPENTLLLVLIVAASPFLDVPSVDIIMLSRSWLCIEEVDVLSWSCQSICPPLENCSLIGSFDSLSFFVSTGHKADTDLF